MKFKKLLVEETLDDLARAEKSARAVLGNSTENVESQGDIERELTSALRKARIAKIRKRGTWTNVLLEGQAGTGKTARVEKWAYDNGINLVQVKASELDRLDLGGAPIPDPNDPNFITKLPTKDLRQLNKPNSVLFLDEWNRAPTAVRATLLTLIQDHILTDPTSESRTFYLENFLFTVAAINPDADAGALYDVIPLDKAERSRFKSVFVQLDKDTMLKALSEDYGKDIEVIKAQLDEHPDDPDIQDAMASVVAEKALLTALLSSEDFEFDSMEDERNLERDVPALVSRTLMNAIHDSEGDKDEFIRVFPQYANPARLPMIKDILADFTSNKDKANDLIDDLLKDAGITNEDDNYQAICDEIEAELGL